MGKDIIGLVLQSLILIFIGVNIIFQIKLKDADKDIFDIMKSHLDMISLLRQRITILEEKVANLEKKEDSPKKRVRNVSSK